MGNDVVLAPAWLLPLLEIYCSPAIESCPHVRHINLTGTRMLGDLIDAGLVKWETDAPIDSGLERHGLVVTEKAVAYINALLRMPLPVAQWIVPSSI